MQQFSADSSLEAKLAFELITTQCSSAYEHLSWHFGVTMDSDNGRQIGLVIENIGECRLASYLTLIGHCAADQEMKSGSCSVKNVASGGTQGVRGCRAVGFMFQGSE